MPGFSLKFDRFKEYFRWIDRPGFALAMSGVIAIAGILLLFYHTRYGPATSSDSVSYIQGAINLIAGRGYSRFTGDVIPVPITHFPPVFSAVLGCIAWFVRDMMEAGRILNTLLFGANLFLIGFLIHRYTDSLLATLFGCLFVFFSKSAILSHASIMSEPLFIFWLLLSITSFSIYLQTPRNLYILITGILVALLGLTRYAGLSLIAAFSLAIALYSRESWKRRMVDIILLCLASLLPIGAWVIRNEVIAGTIANRVAGYYSIPTKIIQVYMQEWTGWLFPFQQPFPSLIALAFSGVLVVALAFIFTDRKIFRVVERERGGPLIFLPWILLLVLPIYQFALVANTTFFDPTTSSAAARRYLVPVLYLVILLGVCIVYRLAWVNHGRIFLKSLSLAYGLLVLIIFAKSGLAFIMDPRASLGLTSERFNMPNVYKAIQKLNPSRILISNNPQMLYILSGRTAYRTPIWYNSYTKKYLDTFPKDLAIMQDRMKAGAVLIFFTKSNFEDDEEYEYEQAYFEKITADMKPFASFQRAIFYVTP